MIRYHSKGASVQVRVEAIDAEHNSEHLPVNVLVAALCRIERFGCECNGLTVLQNCCAKTFR